MDTVLVKRRKAGENRCEFIFTIYLFFPYIVTTFNNTIRHFISNTYKLDTLFLYGLFTLFLLISIKRIAARISSWQIILCISIIGLLAISTVFSSNQDINIEVAKTVCASCMPALLMAGTVRDFAALKSYLEKAARITPYCLAFVVYVLGVGVLSDGKTYSQSMSYYVLLPLIILSGELIERFSLRALVPFIICFIIMLSYGARGPVVCGALYCVIKFLITIPVGSRRRRVIAIAVVAIVGSVVYIYFYDIIQWLLDIFGKLGFSTRSLKLLLDKSFLEDSSRSKISNCCIEKIGSNVLLGTGIVNDRIYITNNLFAGQNPIGNYPHNIILEILTQFGLLVGGGLILYMGAVLAHCFGKGINQCVKSIVLIFVGNGLFPLLFSGSYIDSSEFYVLVGVCGAVLLQAYKANQYDWKSCTNVKKDEKQINSCS